MPYAWTNGFRTYYEEWGEGFPVVLIHGHTFDATLWDDQVSPLAEQYRVITYDVRGHGQSEVPASGYWSSSYAEDLRQLLDHLGVEKAVLVAQAAGGSIAGTFCFDAPERVPALVLAGVRFGGSSAREPEGDYRRAVKELARARGVRVAMEALWLPRPVFQGARLRPSVYEHLRRMCLGFSGVSYLDDTPAPHEAGLNDRLGEIRVPALLLYGDLDSVGVVETADRARATMPQVEVRLMPGTGHTLNMEEPEIFNRHVLEFLGRVVPQS